MSILTQFSKNILSSLFGKKKINDQEGTREIGALEDTNSDNSIPSFSILNRSKKNDHDYLHSSSLTQRENIFFGKDFESNDTNEIIDYNLKKLRNSKNDVITTCIDASGELINSKESENKDSCDIKIKTKVNGSPSLNMALTDVKTNNNESDKKIEELIPNSSKDNNDETDSDSDSDSDSDTDSDSDSDSDTDCESEELNLDSNNTNVNKSQDSFIYLNNNSNENSQQQQQQQQQRKKITKHNSIDDIILEDLDMDKLIYNVPPPIIKINYVNPMDTIPLKRFNDSISMPANLTKFSTSALGQSYCSYRSNILSRSLSTSQNSNIDEIPGIKTIELKKLNVKSNIPGKSSKKHSLSNNFSSKNLSTPLSSSLLAIQYDHPSFTSLIANDVHSDEEVSDTEPSYYPAIAEDEEEYDIFDIDK